MYHVNRYSSVSDSAVFYQINTHLLLTVKLLHCTVTLTWLSPHILTFLVKERSFGDNGGLIVAVGTPIPISASFSCCTDILSATQLSDYKLSNKNENIWNEALNLAHFHSPSWLYYGYQILGHVLRVCWGTWEVYMISSKVPLDRIEFWC